LIAKPFFNSGAKITVDFQVSDLTLPLGPTTFSFFNAKVFKPDLNVKH
jgi:hypothetical protein